jgi:hypothetical protein
LWQIGYGNQCFDKQHIALVEVANDSDRITSAFDYRSRLPNLIVFLDDACPIAYLLAC